MRIWRVGSISMGASLLSLGVMLLLSQFIDINTSTILIMWWPIILIVLGIEVLLYLFLSKQEKPTVKYDLLSIFFIGIIGMVGIGLTILTTTGMLDRINDWASIEKNTVDLPKYEMPIGKEINRVVVNTGSNTLTIEDTQHDDLSIFGTYRAQTIGAEPAIGFMEDYLLIVEKGDTLYISFKEIYNLPQPFNDWIDVDATLLIPSDVRLEVNGKDNRITLKPRNIENAWFVQKVYHVDVFVANDNDISIKAENVANINGEGWGKIEDTDSTALMKIGDGTYPLIIDQAETVSVSTH